jgi:hypothetical protein
MQGATFHTNANTASAALETSIGRRLGRAVAGALAARGMPVAVHYNELGLLQRPLLVSGSNEAVRSQTRAGEVTSENLRFTAESGPAG